MTGVGPPEIEHVRAALDAPLDCPPNKEMVGPKSSRARIQSAVLVDRGSLESKDDDSRDRLDATVGKEQLS
jgi:hypothetical protein